jgi:mannobiose 2-epimerase
VSDLLQLAGETEAALRRHVIDAWFPRCIDTQDGGFYSNFARDWQREPSQGKFSVFQGRLTWIAAEAAARRPDLRERLLPAVTHGAKYLRDVMWDRDHGGFFWGLDDNGQIASSFGDRKHLYGMSFCLYGLAAAHRALNDSGALELAQRAFSWIDDHAHDAENGGYFEWLARDGKMLKQDATRQSGKRPGDGFPVGRKSMNTHIHLLESFTALYEVWNDPTLRHRLEELLSIVRDRICVEPGALNLFFTDDWRPVSNRDSYGHDIETAYLLLETAEVLGVARDAKTNRVAKRLVDHSLDFGFDQSRGGFFNEGPMLKPADDFDKEWWVQAEGLNALLLMHEVHGSSTSRYLDAFQAQWRFIREHLIDPRYGGLFQTLACDDAVKSDTKGHIWKCAYHDGRAFLSASDQLRKLITFRVS